MIISISGKIGSGKDTLGKILLALIDRPTCFDKLDVITEEDLDYAIWDKPHFKIKKFADKLKDMVCILLNCTREQLESIEFKGKDLGEEWKCYEIYNPETYNTVKIVLTKDEAIDFIEDNYEFHFCLIRKRTLTPRLLLQLLGTQCGRDILHPNIWVNALFSNYKEQFISGGINNFHDPRPSYKSLGFPNWIITDTRFPNEFEAVKSRGGICIKIERDRPCHVCGTTKHERKGRSCEKIGCPSNQPLHESETALDKQTFDYEIHNNGSIKELVEIAKKFLKEYEIKK